jgi:hypothetical protein
MFLALKTKMVLRKLIGANSHAEKLAKHEKTETLNE